ncbi:MAG: peptidoglycan-associated lipoprotein Pal [Hellea sp.]|nr:peptidoglycan-associated lipoprotein Pal [Hellea sp.]
MKTKTIILAGAALFFAACSSTPEPEPVQAPVQTAPIPAPVQTAPTPAPVQNTSPVTGPIIQGPLPGSLDDFHFVSGGQGRVFFALDKHDLSSGARESLKRQAQWLQTYQGVTAVIEGNADERGTREYNLALAARRAESVKSFLVSLGVSPSRLTTVSYGKERPIDPRSNEEGWARNRNAHTNLMSGSIG